MSDHDSDRELSANDPVFRRPAAANDRANAANRGDNGNLINGVAYDEGELDSLFRAVDGSDEDLSGSDVSDTTSGASSGDGDTSPSDSDVARPVGMSGTDDSGDDEDEDEDEDGDASFEADSDAAMSDEFHSDYDDGVGGDGGGGRNHMFDSSDNDSGDEGFARMMRRLAEVEDVGPIVHLMQGRLAQRAARDLDGPLQRSVLHALARATVTASMAAAMVDVECPVCLDAFEVGAEITRPPCMHPFHVACVKKWFERSSACPTCRQDVSAMVRRAGRMERELDAATDAAAAAAAAARDAARGAAPVEMRDNNDARAAATAAAAAAAAAAANEHVDAQVAARARRREPGAR